MKKKCQSLCFFFLVIIIMLCTACGDKDSQDSTAYYDIMSSSEKIFPVSADGEGKVIGMQFFQGRPVKLTRIEKYEDGVRRRDYYLCEADGSRRMLLKDTTDFFMQGFVDEEGSFYSIQPAETSGTDADFRYDLVKWDGMGEKLFQVTLDLSLGYMGQLDSGEILLRLLGGGTKLLNAETGELADVRELVQAALEKAIFVIGVDGNSMIAADSKEVWKIDAYTGTTEPLLSCVGTTYELLDLVSHISDCRNSGDGELKLLYQSSADGEGTLETLARMDVSEGRTPVTLRGMHFTGYSTGQWLKDRIVDFNGTSEKYFVVLEECPDGTAEEDYARMTSVEIAAKKGPDILMGSAFGEYIQGMIEKGAFEDLNGYMKKSGIREEDFFPGTFACYRSGRAIYSDVSMVMNHYGKHRDGAWGFLCFLLQEETQEKGRGDSNGYPANKAAFEQLLLKEKAEGPVKRKAGGGAIIEGDGKPLTEQDMEELRQILEEARYPVFQTEEILDIICEEAQHYFNGVKSVEQVADVIENRVRLYLKEHR